jgi:serine protease DegQ
MLRLTTAGILSLLMSAPVLAAAEAAPKPRESAGPIEVPYKLTDSKHIMVRVKLNGKGPFNFILDTGAPALIMTEALAKKAGAELTDGWGTFKLQVEGGVVIPRARGLAHDMFQLKGMNALGVAGAELHGVLGYNILAQYKIQYDFTSDKLLWTPLDYDPPKIKGLGNKVGGNDGGLAMIGDIMKFMAPLLGVKPNFELKPRGFMGLELEEKKGDVRVKSVLPGSPADRAGLKSGDLIVATKKHDVDSIEDVLKAAAKLAEGEKLELKIKRHDTKMDVVIELGKGL